MALLLDARLRKLAQTLVGYSCQVQPGEKVLIEMFGPHHELTRALVEEVYAAGGLPFVWLREDSVRRAMMLRNTPEQLDIMADNDAALMRQMQVYIGVRGGNNATELSDVPADRFECYNVHYHEKVHGIIRVPQTRWVVLRYPSEGMSQKASMSTEAFEDFYFDVCTMDYGKLSRAMDALVDVLNRTDVVRITGPGTDLTFSIKGLPAGKADGSCNIPDGEVGTAPVRDSVHGTIAYNTPSIYNGVTYDNIRLTFEKGRIVDCSSNHTAGMQKIFDTDEGARYVGEFAIGTNPYLDRPILDTLFDEKIAGSLHFTPGACYDSCDNGNHSAIHWDLVLVQTPEYGGGNLYFDGQLVRQDGRFILPELQGLNVENFRESHRG